MSEHIGREENMDAPRRLGLGDVFMYAAMLAATPLLSHRLTAQIGHGSGLGNETVLIGGVMAGTAALGALALNKAIDAKPLSALTAALFAAAFHVGGLAGVQDSRLYDWRGSCFDYGAEAIGIDIYDRPTDPEPVCNIYDFKR